MAKKKIAFLAFIITIIAAMLAIGTPAIAQDQTSKVIPNSIWVGADGKFESDPDTALVQFGISAQQEKLQDANQKATQAAEQVRQLLRSNGIDPSEAQISRFATQPVYDYKNAKRKLVGYRVDANISIKVKDFSKIGPISEGLANMEVTDTSITYQLDNIDAAKIKAVQDALRRAHDEANAVAQAGGRGSGRVILCLGRYLRAAARASHDDEGADSSGHSWDSSGDRRVQRGKDHRYGTRKRALWPKIGNNWSLCGENRRDFPFAVAFKLMQASASLRRSS